MRPPVTTPPTTSPADPHAELEAAEAAAKAIHWKLYQLDRPRTDAEQREMDAAFDRVRRAEQAVRGPLRFAGSGGYGFSDFGESLTTAPAPAVRAALPPGSDAVKQAAFALAADLLADPRTRDMAYEIARDTKAHAGAAGRYVAGGVTKVTPNLLRALGSFTSARTGCSCGHQHDGADRTIARLRTLADARAPSEARSRVAGGVLKSDAKRMWKTLADSFYSEGDLPVLAVRECLQNSLDAMSERAKKGELSEGDARFEVRMRGSTLVIEDNGIGLADRSFRPSVATPLSPRFEKFITLGGSQKAEESFGGFGVAKAIILGTGKEGWIVESGWVILRAPSADPESVYDIEEAPSFRQGVKITLLGVDTSDRSSPYTLGNSEAPEDRIKGMLELNKVPGVSIRFDGSEVRYRHDGRRSISNTDWSALEWSAHKLPNGRPACTGTVRSYDRDGSDSTYTRIVFRLRKASDWGEAWLVQHAEMMWRAVPRDILLDLAVRVKPDEPGYPLRASRDGFTDRVAIESLNRIKSDITDEAKQKELAAKEEREKAAWEDIFPDSTDPAERRGADLVDSAIEEGLAGMADEMKAILAEMLKYTTDPSQYAKDDEGDGPDHVRGTGGVKIEDAPEASAFEAILDVVKSGNDPQDVARAVNALADAAGVTLPADVQVTLSYMSRGDKPDASDTVEILDAIGVIDSTLAGDPSTDTTSTAWTQAPAISAVADAVAAVSSASEAPSVKKAKDKINPFGNRAFIRISRSTPPDEVKMFKRNIHKYVGLLAIWDSALRIVAHAARQKKSFQPGFFIEAGTRGYCVAVASPNGNGKARIFVCINPLLWDQYVKLYPQRADLLARYIFEIACHEVAHIDYLGTYEGHGDNWIRLREDLGFNAAAAIPLITTMVQRLLKIKGPRKGSKGSKGSDAKDRRELERLRAELDAAHSERAKLSQDVLYYRNLVVNGGASVMHQLLTRLDQHERVVSFCAWLRRLPATKRPAGMDAAAWERFVTRLAENPGVALRLIEEGRFEVTRESEWS